MQVGYWLDYDHTYTFAKLFHAMEKRRPGIKPSGIVVNDRYLQHAKDELPPGSRLISFYSLIEKLRQTEPNAADLAEFRAFDERHALARVAYSDRHISAQSYDEIVRLYTGLLAVFRDYVRSEKLDLFIFPVVASQYTHLMYRILREEGVPVLMPYHFGIEDLHAIIDNPYCECPDMVALFQAMRSGEDAPTAAEREWAEGYIARIRAGDRPYRNLVQGIEDRRFALPNAADVFRYLKNYLLYYRNDFTQPSPWSKLRKIFWLRRNRRTIHSHFKSPDEIGGDFVLFPLHYEPEIATLIYSQFEQSSFIDFVVRQLPVSHRLVVKEHPVMLGQRSAGFYRDLLRKYPNLMFVEPAATANSLLRRAKALLTLSGTSIMESLILGCPVVFTSRSRFGQFGLGRFTQNVIDIAPALADAMTQKTDEEDLVRMLAAIRRQCRRFIYVEPLGEPATLADDNIGRIADALLEAYDRTTRQPALAARAAGVAR